MPPIVTSDAESADDEEDDEAPPMPFYAFEGTTRAVLLQGDRIALTWNSEPESDTYPTFGVLATELMGKFEDLVTLSRDRFSIDVEASRVDVRYVNKLSGVSADEYVIRLLAGFEKHPDLRPAAVRDSIIFSDHWHKDECLAWVRIESDPPDDTSLDITVRRPLSDLSLESCLDTVHRVAIDAFIRNTPESLREAWGQG